MGETPAFRDRVKGLRRVKASELVPHEANWRTHPPAQEAALRGILNEVGFAGAILAREREDGRLVILDGHLRADLLPDQEIPVLVLDVSEDEGRKILATHDPVGAMAEMDRDGLKVLLSGLSAEEGPLKRLLASIADSASEPFEVARLDLSELRFHPRNYRKHPSDQLAHIQKSIEDHGYYRNVVVARDGTVLAGQGVVEACRQMGRHTIPVVRLPLDPEDPRAWKVMAGDNEIARLAEVDDRALTELLKAIMAGSADNLLGTGLDAKQLAALVMVTRPAGEIRDFDAAAEWVGMPDYEEGARQIQLIITFLTREDRDQFIAEKDLKIDSAGDRTSWSARWPWTPKLDKASIRFIDPDSTIADTQRSEST